MRENRELRRLCRELDELADLLAYAPEVSPSGRASILCDCRSLEARIARLKKSLNPIDIVCV